MNLKIEGITKQYKNNIVLDNFYCDLTPGIYGLVGPNGAGKTTLLRILSTVIRPSKGRILIKGEDITLREEDYRDIIGYLPQKLGFYRNYTPVKFLEYISSLKGLDKDLTHERVTELIKLFNLTQYTDKKIKTLSEGIKQRIGISQALLNDPRVLILDEPTLNLDPKERINFRNTLSKLSTNKIILVSTHIISDIECISKEIILLKDGKKIDQGAPSDLLTTLSSKVWEAKITAAQLHQIQADYLVTEIKNIGSDIRIRIISDKKPAIDCCQTAPLLDDLYMYYFGWGNE